MNQFKSDYFVFDGIDSEEMGIMMCTIGGSAEDLVFGLNRTVNQFNSIGDIKILKNISNEYHTFSITLTKVDTLVNGKKVLGKFTPQELSFIQKWLFKNEYKPFVPKNEDNSLIYYVLFTGESGFLNDAKQGYLTFTMSVYPYAYREITFNKIIVEEGENKCSILNDTNIEGRSSVDIIVNMGLGDSISIVNITNNTKFSISNMEKGQSFIAHGLQQYIENKSNNEDNLYSLSEKSFIELNSGRNDFVIELTKGKAEVIFKYQTKMAIY